MPGSVWGELLPTCIFFLSWMIFLSRTASTRGSFNSEHPQASLLQHLPKSNSWGFFVKASLQASSGGRNASHSVVSEVA